MSRNRIDGDVQAAIQLLREGKTLATVARQLDGLSYRGLQAAVKRVVGPEEYRTLMVKKGKSQGRQQQPPETE